MIAAPILVLIVNYRTPALTMQAVGSIADEVRSRGDAHILVVDNGSDDGSAAAIATAIAEHGLGDCCSLLALDDNRGFAVGNNAGISHYRQVAGKWPDHVWLLNPDTIAEAGTLGALVAFLEHRADVDIAGGRCLRPDGTIRHSAFRFHSPLGELISALDFGPLSRWLYRHDVVMPIADQPHRADWLSGAHLMIRGKAMERIGLLDPHYFLYFEETDFCSRASLAGLEAWYVPESRIVHLGGQATGVTEARPVERRPRYWFASRARFFLRRYGVARTHLANLLWLVASPAGTLLARSRGRPRHDPPRFWWDFLMHYYGPGGLMYRTDELRA